MTDRIKICDVVDSCEECPRYGNDCDGGGDAEVNETKSPYMQQSRHDDGRMTREEAIKILEEEAEFLYGGDEPYNKIAFDMAIEALSQPIVAKCYEIEKDYIYCSPETAEVVCNALHLYHSTNVQNMHNADLISRADAIEALTEYYNYSERMCIEIKALIEDVPSADAESKWTCTANFVAEQLDKLEDMTASQKVKLIQDLLGVELKEENLNYEHATLVDIKEPLKVAVVRCKDCRHQEFYLNDNESFHCDKAHIANMHMDDGDGDFFCKYGERREP